MTLPGQYPPPLPQQAPRRNSFYDQAAKASWRAPILAFLFGFCTMSMRDKDRTAALIMGSANGLIILIGILATLVALYGGIVRRVKGVIVPAVIGLIVNGLIIFAIVSVFFAGFKLSQLKVQQARQQALADAERQGHDAAEKYPGWIGFIKLPGGATIGITEMNSDAPMSREIKSMFLMPCMILNLAADNSSGSAPVVLDPDSAEFHFNDGRVLKAIDTRSVFSTAHEDRDKWMTKAGPRTAPARGKMVDGMLLLPDGTSLVDLTEIVINIDGRPLAIPGRYLSVAEKTDLMERARQMQKSNGGGR
jgi:hypothetical protein